MVRGRFAPSPTGLLHVGNARTALAAWLSVRRQGGVLVLRVEDLDPPRSLPGAAAAILDDLRWLGLDWDEGPDVDGPFTPYNQSERLERYQAALDQLAAAGLLFPCTCSRAELRRLASAPNDPSEEGPPYSGRCRGRELGPDDLLVLPGRRLAIRFRVPPGEVCFDDAVCGRRCQDVRQRVGDFVLRRADGLFAYQLAVVVDDVAMEIDEVVRGADLLESTARQCLLYQALGAAPPRFAHVPLVLGPAGERLAKRHGGSTIGSLRGAGKQPESVIGLLGWSLGLLDRPEPVAARELVDRFSWELIPSSPWVYRWPDLDSDR